LTDIGLRLVSVFGFFAMLAIAWGLSNNRRLFPWRTVLGGIAIQLSLAWVLLISPVGPGFFIGANAFAARFISYTNAGVAMVFGPLQDVGFSLFLNALPVIIFMGTVFSILYHLGIVQRIVDALAWGLSRTMGLSGAESLAAIANIFVGMTESGLVVKPYLARMTQSELFSLMSVGMGTVAGSVLIAYVGMLGGGDFAGHLVIASLLSAPAGLIIAKIMMPETEVSETAGGAQSSQARDSINVIDAAATGALNGLRLAAYVGALLIAFRALIELLNDAISSIGGLFGASHLTLELLLGYAMAPMALLMGIAPSEAVEVGSLLGIKTVLNEFLAYIALGEAIEAGSLSQRSILISSYALCGFANFGSLAILLGGIGGLAPERRGDVARLGLRAIVAGSLTTFMTACLAGAIL
jgi:CNT family concentrative nucleoside transporter